MRKLDELKIEEGTRVLLRVDYNVPLLAGKVADNWRMIKTLPTINYLFSRKASIVLMSHLGRPKGAAKKELSLLPVAEHLSTLLGSHVEFYDALPPSQSLQKYINKMRPGGIGMLENLRFSRGEEAGEASFAKALAKLGDVFVNDAFGAAHRSSASITLLPRLLPAAAGLLLEKEVEMLQKIITKPAAPFILMMGGAKISDKIGVIKNLIKNTDKILLGGALVNNFFSAMGYGVGSSLYDKKEVAFAKGLLKQKKIILPEDVVVGIAGKSGSAKVVAVAARKKLAAKGEAILDIGPKTVRAYASRLKGAATIVWNGPLGLIEERQFSHGTLALARTVAARSKGKAFGIVGGGETVEALRRTKMEDMVDWVSTGGGAMLEFLEGKTLPGIKALL